MEIKSFIRNIRRKQIVLYKRYLKTIGESKYLSRYLFRIAQFGIYAFIALVLINILGLLFDWTDTLGTFGDFLGGTLNPIFTFLTLISLIVTIVLQKVELSLARAEFKRSSDSLEAQSKNLEYQRFENTFFKLLDFFESCRDDVSYESINHKILDKIIISGRSAVKGIYLEFTKSYLPRHPDHTTGADYSDFLNGTYKPNYEIIPQTKQLWLFRIFRGENLSHYSVG
ncbi:hypothetical protein [Thiofilum flexile]|uniref:hypothetical protein n=1 Tax=Thiofilum flexile TaxID=125627 RepID=UPI0003819D87|nr:hypothetical protein [Thiofilum flexile]